MSAHSKDDLAAAERYACIGRLRWEAEQKKDKSSPKSDLRRSGSLRAKAGKVDSTIAVAAATATTTTVVVGGKQTKKKFDAATAGKRAMRVDGKIGEGEDWRSRISRFKIRRKDARKA
jgi:hypothetical protein